MGLLDIVSGIFKPVADVIEHLTVSGDQKVALQQAAMQGQFAAASQIVDYEKQLLEARSSIIKAEAQSNSWLARSWRPITMLVFVALVVARFMGYTAPNLSPAEAMELWGLIKLGLGGYIGGRSLEKIAPQVTDAIKSLKR